VIYQIIVAFISMSVVVVVGVPIVTIVDIVSVVSAWTDE